MECADGREVRHGRKARAHARRRHPLLSRDAAAVRLLLASALIRARAGARVVRNRRVARVAGRRQRRQLFGVLRQILTRVHTQLARTRSSARVVDAVAVAATRTDSGGSERRRRCSRKLRHRNRHRRLTGGHLVRVSARRGQRLRRELLLRLLRLEWELAHWGRGGGRPHCRRVRAPGGSVTRVVQAAVERHVDSVGREERVMGAAGARWGSSANRAGRGGSSGALRVAHVARSCERDARIRGGREDQIDAPVGRRLDGLLCAAGRRRRWRKGGRRREGRAAVGGGGRRRLQQCRLGALDGHLQRRRERERLGGLHAQRRLRDGLLLRKHVLLAHRRPPHRAAHDTRESRVESSGSIHS